ncbi:MAG: hypothetical protein ACOVOD_09325 [Rhodoferax sp.]
MKILLYVLILFAATFVGVYIFGYTLEPVRSGTSSKECEAPAKEVLATMLDVESQPKWRKGLASVQRTNESSAWVEKTQQGEEITFILIDANDRSVSMSFVSDRGYSGKWSAELVQQSSTRTNITVNEEVTVESPIGRVISRILFNPEEFASTYLTELCSETRNRVAK